MKIGLIGRKCGMTRVFDEQVSNPVSVIAVEPNSVTQVKTLEKDGYAAIQVTTGTKKASRVNKPRKGQFLKAGVEAGRGLWEFRLPESLKITPVSGEDAIEAIEPGLQLTVQMFKAGDMVNVTGTSKGKGFAGVVKRHNFQMQDATHGNSLSHRAPGSIGQNQSPGRVFKGKKMAGQMGNKRVTAQNLEIIRVDLDKNLLLVKGAIPGAPNGNVIVTFANKQKKAGN